MSLHQIILVFLVLIIVIVVIYSYKKKVYIRKDKYRLQKLVNDDFPGINTAPETDIYYARGLEEKLKPIKLKNGEGISLRLEPVKETYYEVSIISSDNMRVLHSLPYFMSSDLKIPNDLMSGSIIFLVRVPKETIVPNSWFTSPFIQFTDVKKSTIGLYKRYMPESDIGKYDNMGEEYRKNSIKFSKDYNFYSYIVSKERQRYFQSFTIYESIQNLNLKDNQIALCIIPNRSMTMSPHMKSSIYIDDKMLNTNEDMFYKFEIDKPNTKIKEIIYGIDRNTKCLPFYIYIFQKKSPSI